MSTPILAAGTWKTNGELIADVARLGYLTTDGYTWDATHGLGTFWTHWRPNHLVRTDIEPAKSPDHEGGLDATDTNWPDGLYQHIAVDPPYKLNGKDQGEGARYGVTGDYASVASRLGLMAAMLAEAHRLLAPGGTLLYKCQDQTNAGRKVWQTDLATRWATDLGLVKVDLFQFPGYRPQPQRSRCRLCEAPIMRRADGRWGRVSRLVDDVFACPALITLKGTGDHEPDPNVTGQDGTHTNYSTLLVFGKDTP